MPFWQQVYFALAEDNALCRYFAPLPVTSYHMTALHLYTRAMVRDRDWQVFLSEHRPLFQRMAAHLNALPLTLTLTMDTIVVSDVIQLHGYLPAPQHEAIVALASQFQLEDKLPRVFHVTLAYRYRCPAARRAQAMTHRINDRLQTLLQANSFTWSLQSPGLYWFDDMTAFIPWDDQGPGQ